MKVVKMGTSVHNSHVFTHNSSINVYEYICQSYMWGEKYEMYQY